MRHAFRVIVLLLATAAVAFLLWPAAPAPPISMATAPQPGEEEEARHIQLGLLYEQSGLLSRAEALYEQAIYAEQPEIAAAARDGLRRVLARQYDPRRKLQADVRLFLIWIMQGGLKLLTVVAGAWGVWSLIRPAVLWGDYVFLPFKDYSGTGIGESLPSMILTTIEVARLAHLKGEPRVFAISERLNMPGLGTLEEKTTVAAHVLEALGSLKIGTIDFPVVRLVAGMQSWARTRACALSGSVYRYGAVLWLEAKMKRGHAGEIVHVWESRRAVPAGTGLAEQAVVQSGELAYKILYDLCPGLGANAWQSFRLFTEALTEMGRYQTDGADSSILESAASKLEAAVALDPGYLLAKHNLGLVYNNLGQHGRAVDLFKEVKEADSWLTLEATYDLGVSYYHLFQDWAYEQAICQFEEILESPQRATDSRHGTLLALCHAALANVYAQQLTRNERDSQALFHRTKMHYDQAVSLAGEDRDVLAVAHAALGMAHLGRGSTEEAAGEFRTALSLKANYPVALVYLANCYLQQGDQGEAARWLRRAVRLRPRYEYAHYQLAELYRSQGETELAYEAFHQAPTIAGAQNGLGKLLAEAGRYDEALDAFRRAIGLNSKFAEAHSNLAWYTVEAGLCDEAALQAATESARRALQLNRGTSHAWHSHDVLGWVYYHHAKLEDAEKEFKASIEKEPARAQPRYHLALVCQARGDYDAARRTLMELFKGTSEKGLWREKAEELMQEL